MAKVVTESPRYGHANPSKKWGQRLRKNEYDASDHGPSHASMARGRQYAGNAKSFTDVLGPLRRYLRKQVGRPWDHVWSDITRTLDSRSPTGQHIFDHIRWEVKRHTYLGDDGRVYHQPSWGSTRPVDGLYVHPETGLLSYRRPRRTRFRWGPFADAERALRVFGFAATTAGEIRRFRIEGMSVWERRNGVWFIHTYRHVPAQVTHVITRMNGREVHAHSHAHRERVATRQANKKELRTARALLQRDPIGQASLASGD